MLNRAIKYLAAHGIHQFIRKLRAEFATKGFYAIARSIFASAFTKPLPVPNDYRIWLSLKKELELQERKDLKQKIHNMANTPMISILMPTFNPKIEWLNEAVQSVRDQIYQNWELCIADDCSTNAIVKNQLLSLASSDNRIKLIFREKNGHISAASNSALAAATGDWIALLDHDDMLHPHALARVAVAVMENPKAELIYTDEDKLAEGGKRIQPYFKPDWNPDLFLSQNYLCHLSAYKAELMHSLGGFRLGYEGAQDYDLALRAIGRIASNSIIHIPHISYHWRMHDESTAASGSNKNYATRAGKQALDDHFKRANIQASAEILPSGNYRAHYQLTEQPLVSLIIPTRNGLKLIEQCIESIVAKSTYKNYEIIVVDNGSDDLEALKYFEKISSTRLARVLRDDRPFNYSALNNNAIAHASGEFVVLVNNDIEVISPDWLEQLLGLALQQGVGAVGARLWYPDNTLQHGGVVLGVGGVAGHSHKYLKQGELGYFSRADVIQTFSAVTAACLMVRKSIYLEVGGLNEKDLAVAFNDVDFCLRVRAAGYRNVWTPYAELYHHESVSRGSEDTPAKQARFSAEVNYMLNTWAESLQTDPAYNPNLSLKYEDFRLRWPDDTL
jgi:glycosyltransferase involved in cell wall biosynthesis